MLLDLLCRGGTIIVIAGEAAATATATEAATGESSYARSTGSIHGTGGAVAARGLAA